MWWILTEGDTNDDLCPITNKEWANRWCRRYDKFLKEEIKDV